MVVRFNRIISSLLKTAVCKLIIILIFFKEHLNLLLLQRFIQISRTRFKRTLKADVRLFDLPVNLLGPMFRSQRNLEISEKAQPKV